MKRQRRNLALSAVVLVAALAAAGCGSSHVSGPAGQIAVGGEYGGGTQLACAVVAAGVRCWGATAHGHAGDPVFSSTPVAVPGLDGHVTQISATMGAVCGLVSGRVKCWGRDELGQFSPQEYPDHAVEIPGLDHGVRQVSVGSDHTCALASGRVDCWGDKQVGQLGNLGNPFSDHSRTPLEVVNLAHASQVGAGGTHSCALVSGLVKCWGTNDSGQLGWSRGLLNVSYKPVIVPGLADVTQIAAGFNHTCALISGGARCWGDNTYGELGNHASGGVHASPISVSGLASGVKQVAAGDKYTCALLETGGVECWGENEEGQLGIGSKVERLVPVAVHGLPAGVTEIATGDATTCALTKAGSVWCWGSPPLGDGSGRGSLVPVRVQGLG